MLVNLCFHLWKLVEFEFEHSLYFLRISQWHEWQRFYKNFERKIASIQNKTSKIVLGLFGCARSRAHIFTYFTIVYKHQTLLSCWSYAHNDTESITMTVHVTLCRRDHTAR